MNISTYGNYAKLRTLRAILKWRQRKYLRLYRNITDQLHSRMWYRQEASAKEVDVKKLNALFTPLHYRDRIKLLYEYFEEKEILFTSSFGTRSAFILHLLSQARPSQPVHFINTKFHFKETLQYKEQLSKLLGLNIVEVLPDPLQNQLTREEMWWQDHPRMCCTINKIAPLEPIVSKHTVWISGIMNHQTSFRSNLKVFEKQGDILKFHPIIDIDEGELLYQRSIYKLPVHPLENKGYNSIGCTHCTERGFGREGRWNGTGKKECGLHPNHFNKREPQP